MVWLTCSVWNTSSQNRIDPFSVAGIASRAAASTWARRASRSDARLSASAARPRADVARSEGGGMGPPPTLTYPGRACMPHLPKDPEAVGGRHERPLLIVEPYLLLEDQADALVQRH